jgi:hypothetical protein
LLKLPRTVEATVRPDKIVLYTDSWDHTKRIANALADRLGHLDPQGVPFTASLGADGLISWAIDPRSPARRSFASWRIWITQMIAETVRSLERRDTDQHDVDVILKRLDDRHGIRQGAWSLRDGPRGVF